MSRSVVAVCAAVLMLQTTGLLAVLAPDDCVVTVASESSLPDACPDCVSCLCCPPLLPAVETSTVVLMPVGPATAPLAPAVPHLRDPAPRGILHVPRSA